MFLDGLDSEVVDDELAKLRLALAECVGRTNEIKASSF